MKTQFWLKAGMLGLIGVGVAGCATGEQNGALIGGGTGAAVGAVVGHASHGNTVGGALVGGAIGAVAGAIVGHEADRQQAYADGYYDDRVTYRYAAPPRVYETRTTYRNPDGTTTTYVTRSYGN